MTAVTRSVQFRMSAVAFAALYALVALPRSAIPLIDGDVWWHFRAGDTVLTTGTVPTVDTWSVAGAGMPWISQDWLLNVAMAAAASLGEWGWTLLSVSFALMAVGSLAVLRSAIRLRVSPTSWVGPLVWLAAGLTVAGPTLGVRTQVVDLPLACITLWILWRYMDDGRLRWLIGLPLVAVVWANLHAGWILLFLLGGAVLVGELVDRQLQRVIGKAPLPPRKGAGLAFALVSAAVALLANPNGFALYTYPIQAGVGALSNYLVEWAPPDIADLPGQLLAAFVVLGVVPTLLMGRGNLRTADLLVLIGLCAMAVSAARFLLVAGPICAAIVAIGLGPPISATPVGRRLSPALQRMGSPSSSPLRRALNAALVLLVVGLGIGVTATRVSPIAQVDAIEEHMPVAAVNWLVANDPGDRPFNTYSWGGYLGWRQPAELVFIDGRADVYGEAPIRSYAMAVTLEDDPQELLDRHMIDYVLVNTGTPFAGWLDDSAAWDPVYTDGLASVWTRSEASAVP